MRPTDALQNARAISSPLKYGASAQASAQASSNGTPLASQIVPNATAAAQSTALDIAEQLNEDEKRKYVKGWLKPSMSSCRHLREANTLIVQGRSLVRVHMPMFFSGSYEAILPTS
jgi:hypothetical protein